MTTKLEQAARQLLEVAEGIQHGTDWNNGTHAKIYRPKFPEAITALREALGYCIDEGCPHHGTTHECTNPLAEQAEQEPVSWMNTNGAVNKLREAGWAMNAAPVRTKDLTDDEIQKWIDVIMYDPPEWALRRFARVVIAADRKKNNV